MPSPSKLSLPRCAARLYVHSLPASILIPMLTATPAVCTPTKQAFHFRGLRHHSSITGMYSRDTNVQNHEIYDLSEDETNVMVLPRDGCIDIYPGRSIYPDPDA